MVTSDDHEGLRAAVERYFQGATWQRCQLHFRRNLLDCVAKKDRAELRDEVQSIFNSPDRYFASKIAGELGGKYKGIFLNLPKNWRRD